MVVKVFQEK